MSNPLGHLSAELRRLEIDPKEDLDIKRGAIDAFLEGSSPLNDEREPDQLLEIAALALQLEALFTSTNGNRLATELRRQAETPYDAGFYLIDLKNQLLLIAAAAGRAHQDVKPKPGKRPKSDIRAAARFLASYWTEQLGRKYRRGDWVLDKRGRTVPVTPGEDFVFQVLNTFWPDRAGELRAISHELVANKSKVKRKPCSN